MNIPPFVFTCTGKTQTYTVPESGQYRIVATGAQGGPGGNHGGRGARVEGTFPLQKGERLQIVVGQQGLAGFMAFQAQAETGGGGGGGGTFVWKGVVSLPLPPKPLLAAGGGGGGAKGRDGTVSMDGTSDEHVGGRCGYGGSTNFTDFHYSGGGGTGWRSGGAMGSAPTYCYGGIRWTGGEGANYFGQRSGNGGYGGGGGGGGYSGGGGGGYSGGGGSTHSGADCGGGGGGSFNSGDDPVNTPGAQSGNGEVVITLLAVAWPSTHNGSKPTHAQNVRPTVLFMPSAWSIPERQPDKNQAVDLPLAE